MDTNFISVYSCPFVSVLGMKKYLELIAFNEIRAVRYIALMLMLVCVFGVGFTALNYESNDFGLWRHRDHARIWALEKTSKYLLAHRYVPENFDAILIGPSVSANLDTRQIRGYKVYNLSMSGGNITETGAAARKYLEAPGNHKLMIVCLYPYLTKNSGIKSFQIDEKEYYGSLFSLIPGAVWAGKILGAHDFDESEAGWNNFTPSQPRLTEQVAEDRRQALEHFNPDKAVPFFGIDPQAMMELDDLVKLARGRHVKVVAWYYPVFEPTLEIMQGTGEWSAYKAAMAKIFRPGEIILDMDTPVYRGLRSDMSAYHDGAHMEQDGMDEVIKALNGALQGRHLAK
jgi:hypothetical protein